MAVSDLDQQQEAKIQLLKQDLTSKACVFFDCKMNGHGERERERE